MRIELFFKLNYIKMRINKEHIKVKNLMKDNFETNIKMTPIEIDILPAHYIIDDQLFIDYDEALDYCESNLIPFENILKTKIYKR